MAVCNLYARLWPAWVPMSAYALSLVAWLLEWLCREGGVGMPFGAWRREWGFCVFPVMHLTVFIIMFSMPFLWAMETGHQTVLCCVWAVLYWLATLVNDVIWQHDIRYALP